MVGRRTRYVHAITLLLAANILTGNTYYNISWYDPGQTHIRGGVKGQYSERVYHACDYVKEDLKVRLSLTRAVSLLGTLNEYANKNTLLVQVQGYLGR